MALSKHDTQYGHPQSGFLYIITGQNLPPPPPPREGPSYPPSGDVLSISVGCALGTFTSTRLILQLTYWIREIRGRQLCHILFEINKSTNNSSLSIRFFFFHQDYNDFFFDTQEWQINISMDSDSCLTISKVNYTFINESKSHGTKRNQDYFEFIMYENASSSPKQKQNVNVFCICKCSEVQYFRSLDDWHFVYAMNSKMCQNWNQMN